MLLAITRSMNANPDLGMSDLDEFNSNPDFGIFDINPNMGFALLLLTFVGALTAFFFIFKPLHQREFRTLITPFSRIRYGKIFFAFGLWLALSLGLEMVLYFLNPGDYYFQFQWNRFIPLLILSCLMLPIQTSMEELVFRGYLMQGIGILTGTKWAPILITSMLFGLVHSMNPEIEKFGFALMQSYYMSAGLVLAIMTVMDDGLELALGVHAATNFTGAVFVGYDGAAIKTDALFMTTNLNPGIMLFGFWVVAIIFLIIIKYKYNWESFNILLGKVKAPQEAV